MRSRAPGYTASAACGAVPSMTAVRRPCRMTPSRLFVSAEQMISVYGSPSARARAATARSSVLLPDPGEPLSM